jgi:hypothetical protein
MARKRIKPSLILTFKLFIFSLFDLVTFLTFFLNLYFEPYRMNIDRPYQYLIEIILGMPLQSIQLIHSVWFNIAIWIYHILNSYHVIVLIALHNVMYQAAREMFGLKRNRQISKYATQKTNQTYNKSDNGLIGDKK